MYHFQSGRPEPHLAITANAMTTLQAGLLGMGKMKQAHGQQTAAVLNTTQQCASLAKDHLSGLDFALNHHRHAQTQTGDWHQARAVLILVG